MQIYLIFFSSLIAASIFLGSIHSSVFTLNSLREKAKKLSTELYIEETLSSVMDDIDSSSLLLPPRIHSKGSLTFSDGGIIPISARLRPHNDSNALSNIELDMKGSLWILDIQKDSINFRAKSCLRFSQSYSFQNIRAFIAIGVDGINLVKGKAFKWKNGCKEIVFSKTKSVVVNNSELNSLTFRVLIPIVREYSLYVDKELNLRYLSTAGEEILENQPLLEKIYPVTFSLESPLDGKFFIVRAKIASTNHHIEASHRLIREDYFSILFGMP